MAKVIQVVIAVLVLYVGWCVAQPFILKYKVTKAVENIAQYATIHSEDESIKEFDNRVKQDLGGKVDTTRIAKDGTRGGLHLEKDSDTKQVKARFVYFDEMKIFGKKVKDFEFIIFKEAALVDKMF
ncbi:hypothetical protein J6Z19_07300 [bacterium]|nr:hypothetical protein [bacterium]